ncbi:MAG TPA: tetratricopeptide repeat protein [Burkholderiales bacterium]|nr:tetratricopeptide repeat protein [Burkholderiales bacterium]
MSLLLEALKKAEKAKQDAQRRAQEGGGTDAGELRLADDAPPAQARHVVTRDELPSISGPMDIQSEDLRAESTARSGGLSLQAERATPPPPRGGGNADPQAPQRATARKVFEAKVREPNPRLPFFILMGALGAFAVGTVIYFWLQLRPPATLFNPNPSPPQGEVPVAVAPSAPPGAAASGPVSGIPGLPPVAQAPRAPEPATPPPRAATPASQPPLPRRIAEPPRSPAPAPRAAAPRPRPAPAASVATSRPAPRIHPGVAAGYAAYQAGDLERARAEYGRALRDDPANRDALLGQAAIETRALRYDAARGIYRRLLLADPRDPYAHAALLALPAAQPDPVAAESRLKGLLAGGAEEGVLHFALGNQFAQQARWGEAQRSYARAAAMDPENPDYAYNVAISHEHLRQPQAALEHYQRALSLGLRRTSNFDPSTAQARVQQLSR